MVSVSPSSGTSGAPETNALVSQRCMQTILVRFAKPIKENGRKLSEIRHLPHFLCIQGRHDSVPYGPSRGLSDCNKPPQIQTVDSVYTDFLQQTSLQGACSLNIEMILEAKGAISRTDSLLGPFSRETSSHTHRPSPFPPPLLA